MLSKRQRQLRSFVTICIVVLSCLALPLAQEPPLDTWSVTPLVHYHGGYVEYVLDLPVTLSDGSTASVVSELDFPVDFVTGGVAGVWQRYDTNTHPVWTITALAQTNLHNPAGDMTDRDYINGSLFSSTRSDADVRMYDLRLAGSRRLMHSPTAALHVVLGLDYQYIEQDIIGFEGQQVVTVGGDATVVDVQSDERALYYDIKFLMPHLGLRGQLELRDHLSIEGSAAYTRFYVEDFDNHFLRKKTAVADGYGSGLLSGLALTLKPTGSGLEFQLRADLWYLKADVPQTQRWYGNDPADDTRDPNTGDIIVNDNTGDVVAGLPHEITSLQYAVGVAVIFAL